MEVRLEQHAVGQGGLFSGTLKSPGKSFRWVFDCGSNQTDSLSREVACVAAGGDIDILFLSHLDSDHVSGIDLLLSRVKVREVVLPYLNEETLLLTLVMEAGKDTLSGVFVDALNDLASWFGSRGVETVTFVRGTEDDDDGDEEGPKLPDAPKKPEGAGEREWIGRWTTICLPGPALPVHENLGSKKAQVQQVEHGAVVTLTADILNWVWIPYVQEPPARLLVAFKAALQSEFGTVDTKRIASTAKSPAVREKLRNCYDSLWIDHNLISMTLYAGPLDSSWKRSRLNWNININVRHSFENLHSMAWMFTGDSHLNRARRRKKFIKFYEKYVGMIGVYMLPHHGSLHNHSREVLEAMSNLVLGFAAAGPNSYGHPHSDVRDAVLAQPCATFHAVDQYQRNRIVVKAHFL